MHVQEVLGRKTRGTSSKGKGKMYAWDDDNEEEEDDDNTADDPDFSPRSARSAARTKARNSRRGRPRKCAQITLD